MLGKKKLSMKFEEHVKDFLTKLKFENVDGATDTFLINGIQVDVCGGHENTLLVIECCMALELRKKSVRNKIKELRGVSYTLTNGIKKHPIYKKYEKISYVLATRNIDVRRRDIEFANSEKPRVYIWDDNFRRYYSDLYEKIGHFAKYNLLGEMGIRPVVENSITVPAFMTTINETRMYNFVIDPKDLLEISYVARRETRNERFYQRILKESRVKDIANYVDKDNIIPNNIIIAFNENLKQFVKFHPVKHKFSLTDWPYMGISYGILEFPKDYRSCWIIDGQHRLYSFVKSKKTFHMPIVAFDNLALEDQCRIFLDINKYQKPVPPDLVWDLNGDMIPSWEDGRISNTVKQLNSSGALFHKIFIPSTGIRKRSKLLRMAGICNSIKKSGLARANTKSQVKNPYYHSEPEKTVASLYKGLNEYFECLSNKFTDDWKRDNKGFILSNSGNAIMIGLFEKIVRKTMLAKSSSPNLFDITKYIEPFRILFEQRLSGEDDLKQLKLRLSSEGGRSQFLNELASFIAHKTGDKDFASGIELQLAKVIRELEKSFKECIYLTLGNGEVKDWFKEKMDKVNPAIYPRAVKNLEKHHITDRNKIYMQLTFGDCIAVITSKQYGNEFAKKFVGAHTGFTSKAQLKGALDHINKIRQTQTAHDIGVSLKPHDLDLFKIYIGIINSCLD